MTLRGVPGGWINTDFMTEKKYQMITQERKSKYKHKITVSGGHTHGHDMRKWCEDSYGPGGRRNRWRFGWTQKDSTFFFKSGKDAMMFTLRWSS